ncbi:MAG: hypothetical protein ACD_61C00254G0002 [uncultured bacterium]|nr:MAG: hypothetical protein ACD_61C00254G0002 [uncultured bacterium]
MTTNIVIGLFCLVCGYFAGTALDVDSKKSNDVFAWLGFILSGFIGMFSYLIPVSGQYPGLLFLNYLTVPTIFVFVFCGAALYAFYKKSHDLGYRTWPY